MGGEGWPHPQPKIWNATKHHIDFDGNEGHFRVWRDFWIRNSFNHIRDLMLSLLGSDDNADHQPMQGRVLQSVDWNVRELLTISVSLPYVFSFVNRYWPRRHLMRAEHITSPNLRYRHQRDRSCTCTDSVREHSFVTFANCSHLAFRQTNPFSRLSSRSAFGMRFRSTKASSCAPFSLPEQLTSSPSVAFPQGLLF